MIPSSKLTRSENDFILVEAKRPDSAGLSRSGKTYLSSQFRSGSDAPDFMDRKRKKGCLQRPIFNRDGSEAECSETFALCGQLT